jgi:hypothetical protein
MFVEFVVFFEVLRTQLLTTRSAWGDRRSYSLSLKLDPLRPYIAGTNRASNTNLAEHLVGVQKKACAAWR